MTKPFSPEDARKLKAESLPSEVVEAVNELLAEQYTDGAIYITQKDIEERILRKMEWGTTSRTHQCSASRQSEARDD